MARTTMRKTDLKKAERKKPFLFSVDTGVPDDEAVVDVQPKKKTAHVRQHDDSRVLTESKKTGVIKKAKNQLRRFGFDPEEMNISCSWAEDIRAEQEEFFASTMAKLKDAGLTLDEVERFISGINYHKPLRTKKARRELWKKL